MMNLQELQTIFHHKINCKIFIINNNVYSIIKRRQNDLFRKRTIGTDTSNGVSCPNFRKVAKSFNIDYSLIKNNDNLEEKIKNVLEKKGPIICRFYLLKIKNILKLDIQEQWIIEL